MSEETHEVDEQIFDIDQDEVAEDATDTSEAHEDSDDEIFDEDSEDEQEQEGLELEKDKTPSKAEQVKLDQIKKMQDKINDGKMSIDKLPPAQSWMKRYLKSQDGESAVDHKAIAKEIAREAIREEREELQFADLKDTLNATRLSKEQRDTIKDKFKLFLSKGIKRFEALALATEFAKVDFTGLSEKKRRMTIPQPSTKKSSGEIDESSMTFQDIVDNYPPEKVAEYLKKQVR